MSEPEAPPPEWVERRLYVEGERVTFRGAVWTANHKTVVRPGLTKAWTKAG